MLSNSLPVGPAQQTAEKLPEIFGSSTIKDYDMRIFAYNFSGILQVIISNRLVQANTMIHKKDYTPKICIVNYVQKDV